jgi:hypothetical protein
MVNTNILGAWSIKTKTRMDTQTKFYKTWAIRNGLFSCEAWVMTSRDKSRPQAAEMRFMRSAIGTTRRNTIRNGVIRNKIHEEI